jgi:broad specificity phosphatase PhoE
MNNSIRTQSLTWKLALAALAVTGGCVTAQVPSPSQSTAQTSSPAPADSIAGTTTVYLVRHGEKTTFAPRDPDPDISDQGKRRADALAKRLKDAGVTAIIVSQFKRTGQTAAPLAKALGLTPEMITAGQTGGADSVAAAIMRHHGEKILVVGHTNTIPLIIAALGGPELPHLCDAEYSNLFVMNIAPNRNPTLVRLHYGLGDPVSASQCR